MKRIVTLLIILSPLISSGQFIINPFTTFGSGGNDESGYGTLIYTNNFESSSSPNELDPYNHSQYGNGSLSTLRFTQGAKSFRCVPASVSSSYRSEVQFDHDNSPTEGVIEYDVYYETLPSDQNHTMQFHPETSGGSASPGLWTISGKWVIVNWISGTNHQYTTNTTIPTGVWMTLRHEFKFGVGGYWRMYKDNVLILNQTNTQFGDGSGQYFKLGVNYFGAGTPTILIYYDRLRIWQKVAQP